MGTIFWFHFASESTNRLLTHRNLRLRRRRWPRRRLFRNLARRRGVGLGLGITFRIGFLPLQNFHPLVASKKSAVHLIFPFTASFLPLSLPLCFLPETVK